MSQNSVQIGRFPNFTAPAGGVVSGNAYLIGALLVVATVTAAVGVSFAGEVGGVHNLPKTTGEAWTEGQILYWDGATGKLTTTAGALKIVGCAMAVTASGATFGDARLNGTAT